MTCAYYTVTEAEGLEEKFRMVLELPDSMPDKADLLHIGFLSSFLGNTLANRKEDIGNCILA